jgi:SAM-dependent methyltransferase
MVEDFEFDHMARRPLYQLCPSWLVDHCEIRPDSTVVDLGCGSGIVTQMLLDRFPEAPELEIIALDPSAAELKIARSRIEDPRVTFVHARAQDAGAVIDHADVVILCNVIHQIPIAERSEICEACLDLLVPGGSFGLNTLFYDGAIPPQTRLFYAQWVQETRTYLHQRGIPLEAPQQQPVALELLNPGQHDELLARAGFVDIEVDEPVVDWRAEDWAALSRYSVFIHGALGPAVTLDAGSEALIAGAASALEHLNLGHVPRAWLHLAGRKPENR